MNLEADHWLILHSDDFTLTKAFRPEAVLTYGVKSMPDEQYHPPEDSLASAELENWANRPKRPISYMNKRKDYTIVDQNGGTICITIFYFKPSGLWSIAMSSPSWDNPVQHEFSYTVSRKDIRSLVELFNHITLGTMTFEDLRVEVLKVSQQITNPEG